MKAAATYGHSAFPDIQTVKKQTEKHKLRNDMKQIGISISDFHKIENRYPTAAEFTSFIDLPDIKTHVKGDWIYFPEIQMNSNTPLLISPIIMKDTIIVLRTDTSVQFFEESEVDQFLNSATTEPVEFKATLFQKK